jgi:uncharacterized protein YidB (DUF937 family)
MSKSTPSLLALLGLVAVAGYQNRGRIGEMLADARQVNPSAPGGHSQDTGLLSQLGQMFHPGAAGSALSSGLADLVTRFRATGHGTAADSWIAPGPNMPLPGHDLEMAIGHETLAELEARTGLPRAELLTRLSLALPEVVNRFTPDGRLPTGPEAQALA